MQILQGDLIKIVFSLMQKSIKHGINLIYNFVDNIQCFIFMFQSKCSALIPRATPEPSLVFGFPGCPGLLITFLLPYPALPYLLWAFWSFWGNPKYWEGGTMLPPISYACYRKQIDK